ncbi:MAG: hypothetical protein FWH01_14715, partial [Oscillospiraceae bacterium]|nr:hypothetical protein [Oscillospiraceae bacterium]
MIRKNCKADQENRPSDPHFIERCNLCMLDLSYDEKIELMGLLNWDTLDKCEDMLAVIEGHIVRSKAFTRDRLFVRSLERLPWHYVKTLWGVE